MVGLCMDHIMQFRCTSVWCDRDIRGEMESREMDRPDSDLTGSEPVILKRENRMVHRREMFFGIDLPFQWSMLSLFIGLSNTNVRV